jgi:hypothetical protein
MNKIVLLDSGPLKILINPRGSSVSNACNHWLQTQTTQGVRVLIPEIIDYETRRELLHLGSRRALANLDALKTHPGFLPITSSLMLKAAELWARARPSGHPTASDKALDIDVILAAQAALLIAQGYEVVIAITNLAHLPLFAPAARWQDIV